MPTRWFCCRVELLVSGALLLSSACGTDPAPPGVDQDPTLTGDTGSGGEDAEAEDAASERADSGSRDAGRDGGVRADAASDASADLDSETDDAGADADAARPDAAQPDARSPISLGELWSVERLLVADGKLPAIYVVDAADGKLLDTFEVSGLANVYAGPSGRFGFVLQPEKDLVHVVDMGLIAGLDPDSRALVREAQVLVPPLSGAQPRGFATQGRDRVSVFFEGGAEVFSLRDDARAVEGPAARFAAGAPHAGFVLSLGTEVLTSSLGASGGEVVLARLDAELHPTSTPGWTCSAPSAGAVAGGVAAVACLEGVLRYTVGGGPGTLVPYPEGAQSAGAVAERLVPHTSQAAILALINGRVCAVRDAIACAPELSAGVVDYSFDLIGKRLFVLTLDGVLYVLDNNTLKPISQQQMVEPLAGTPPESERPRLALGRDTLYVSDPQGARVLRVNLGTGKLIDAIALPGTVPGSFAVFRYPE